MITEGAIRNIHSRSQTLIRKIDEIANPHQLQTDAGRARSFVLTGQDLLEIRQNLLVFAKYTEE